MKTPFRGQEIEGRRGAVAGRKSKVTGRRLTSRSYLGEGSLQVSLSPSAFRLSPPDFRHSTFDIRHSSSGVTLIGIIAAIVIMGLLGAGVLMLTAVGTQESIQALNRSQAFFAAESGVSAARAYIETHTNWSAPVTGVMGQATFNAMITSNGVITSIGRQEEAQWTSIRKIEAVQSSAMVVYRQNVIPNREIPRYRIWSSLSGLSTNEQQALSVNGFPQWQRIVASPLTNEFLLVAQNDQRRIWAQTYTNETWFSNTLLNAAGAAPAANARGFDVAYENLSGRGLVVYSVGSSNPQYRLWVSNGWTAAGSVNVGASNPVQWVRLIAKPKSDEIMCLARWRKTQSPAGNYSSAIIWNGSGWTNYTPLERQCASLTNCETLDAAYSTNEALVVYINGSGGPTVRYPKYRTYTTSGWSAEATMSDLGANRRPQWIRVEFNPSGDRAYVAMMLNNRALRGRYWGGGAWSGAYDTFQGVTLEIAIRRCFDIAWSSQGNTLMVAYSRRNQNAQSYMAVTDGVTNFGTLVSTDDGQWSVLKANPVSSAFHYLALDDRSDVNLQSWNGASWALLSELENSSDNNYLSCDMAFSP